MPPTPTPADRLAARRSAAVPGSATPALRRKLDNSRAVELPAPRILAAVFAADALDGNYDEEHLRSLILALPADRPDAGAPYRDVLHYVRNGSPDDVSAYLRAVATASRRAEPSGTLTNSSKAQLLREQRAAERARQVAAATQWLVDFLADVPSGSHIAATDLRELVDDDLRAAAPGRTTFYAAADKVLGPRVRVNGVRTYRLPGAST